MFNKLLSMLELKIPPVIVLLVIGFLQYSLSTLLENFNFTFSQDKLCAVVLFIIGLIVAALGVSQFKKSKTSLNPMLPQAATLVNSGIYTISRNPMYLGMFFCSLAVGVFFKNYVSICFSVVYVFYIQRFQIVPEERFLVNLFGAEFKEYCKKVRAWI